MCANIFDRFFHLFSTKNKSIGEKGERAACDFLDSHGYRIIERNWRTKIGELDIIAEYKDLLVVVEVKTSLKLGLVPPEMRVHYHKQRKIKQLSALYLKCHRIYPPVRFDIIAVWWEPQLQIRHIENAFY